MFSYILPTTRADWGLSPIRNVRRQAHPKKRNPYTGFLFFSSLLCFYMYLLFWNLALGSSPLPCYRISFAAPQMPASFPSCARTNRVSWFAKNTFSWKYFSTYSSRISPALETPPPITITDGSVITAMAARACPR